MANNEKSCSQPLLRSQVMNCSVTLDYLSPSGATKKSVNYKTAKIILGRNQFR